MGNIFYLMGKSASGKDTLYNEIKKRCPRLKPVVLYTTRPMRDGEEEGVQYHFITPERYAELKEKGLIIESRDYNTVHGIWSYMTVKDGQIELNKYNYLMIGTLESYEKMLSVYGEEVMVPLYITLDDGIRLQRAIKREMEQEKPKYAELCRRFLADEADFSEENLKKCGITKGYINDDFDRVLDEIIWTITSY